MEDARYSQDLEVWIDGSFRKVEAAVRCDLDASRPNALMSADLAQVVEEQRVLYSEEVGEIIRSADPIAVKRAKLNAFVQSYERTLRRYSSIALEQSKYLNNVSDGEMRTWSPLAPDLNYVLGLSRLLVNAALSVPLSLFNRGRRGPVEHTNRHSHSNLLVIRDSDLTDEKESMT